MQFYSNNFDDNIIKNLGEKSIEIAKARDALYSDFRLTRFKTQVITANNENIGDIKIEDTFGFSVRVLIDGKWGFAASTILSFVELERITNIACDISIANSIMGVSSVELTKVPAYVDEWNSPIKTDPFNISIDEKCNFLIELNQKAQSFGANHINSFIISINEIKYFISSGGSNIKQNIFRIWPQFNITIIDKASGKFESRKSLTIPTAQGYEYVKNYDFNGDLEKAVEETKIKIKSKSVDSGKWDIILDPSHMWLTIHESCGHATELDRAMGFESNYAGTSFLTADKLNKTKYGSDIINMVADRTQKHGLATRGYDDDGVKTTKWHLVKDGLFVGYQTTREMAMYINEDTSNGCSFSDSWSHFPIQRMPNVSLEPGEIKLSLSDLISDTQKGIYIVGDGSWSIDMQRYNFQFTGQAFYEIEKGKIVGQLKDVAYQDNTVNFWNSCDAICDKSEYKLGGSLFCGKGEPGQLSPVSHGSSPARFRNVNIINTSK
jgi:TldD protein